ncbi:dihydropteroate synthase [Spirulina subsalsa FACHB-351]|uniref:Dihydropteroate synthase n=1 Tax=Spirulina subsalsa FACHB-351 TaxID=234711 RepID=A0ABT3LAI2_9CYAN|nr:dihydropteroate synthase [Spirulina subsalsa]MCW6038527.1 dihydropteroate synthase [Spirulina subsalsa FACHB-351]
MMEPLTLRDQTWHWGKRTYVMGILNITPDSFSDGGEFYAAESAIAQAQKMAQFGADIIDVGGQSTRPGAAQISLDEELERVIPVIEVLREEIPLPLSVDTTRAEVARAAVEAGADMINDISGGTFEPEMFPVVAELGVPYVLMHIRGTPETMQQQTDYQDVVQEVYRFFGERMAEAERAGIARSHIILDPGIGFAKTYEQNIEILRRLEEFRPLNAPLLLGLSRKSFIGHILDRRDPKARVWGTAAACSCAIAHGADILRVHDVPEIVDVARVTDAIYRFQ